MVGNNRTARQFARQLDAFVLRTDRVWQQYQRDGPGRLDSKLLGPIDSAAETLDELASCGGFMDAIGLAFDRPEQWWSELHSVIVHVRQLAHCCVNRPEGLCFVTGEAGIIPRRDLHEAFQQGLCTILDRSRELRAETGPDGD